MTERDQVQVAIREVGVRREFAKETEAKIVAEIPKDLTNHTILQIERLLTAE